MLVVALVGATVARAQPAPPVSATDRVFLERLALARARTTLYEQIARLPLSSELTVGDWAAREIARQRDLRLWVRTRPRSGDARVYFDASCDVDVRVAPGELAALLGEADVSSAARDWPVLWSTGTASLTEKTSSRKPLGWEDVSARGIQFARRAAAADAVYALLERAGRLRVTAAHRLRAFLESDHEVFEAVYAAVERTAEIVVENAPDQVAAAQAKIGMTELIRILTDVHQTHYRGDLFHAPDFREMTLNTKSSELRATGLAVPPNRYRQLPPHELTEFDAPPWANATLSTDGHHQPVDGEELAREERIERARLDGMTELRTKIEALTVHGGVAVAQVLGSRRQLEDDFAVFLSGARVVDEPRGQPGDTLTVDVTLPLERLWKIVRRGMERIEVGPLPPVTTRPVSETTP